jgi:hypothetical protein
MWRLGGGLDNSIVYILLFCAIAVALVYSVDFAYKKIKRK